MTGVGLYTQPRCTIAVSADTWLGLCFVSTVDGATESEKEEAQANANLIAASTDLLAACEAVVAKIDYLRSVWGDEAITKGVCDQIHAAIAKAKGGAA